jgi:NAD(P)-dependent dehydrogenase (short-subunit alcohol dehydrogenase family)
LRSVAEIKTRCDNRRSIRQLKRDGDLILFPVADAAGFGTDQRIRTMQLKNKIAVVTGAASGIGRALARRFKAEGAQHIVVADIDRAGAAALAQEIDGTPMVCNVAVEADVQNVVAQTQAQWGRIDLFCSNAGILVTGGVETSDADWQRLWSVNVLAHVYAARAALPHMLERGEGYFLNTVSAAGLLSQIGSAAYSVTKHAALGFAEWLAITHGQQGIKVSALCPQAVRTPMLEAVENAEGMAASLNGVIQPEQLAQTVIEALAEERFLVLPHPEVQTYFQRKATDYDRWLHGMQRLQAKLQEGAGEQ